MTEDTDHDKPITNAQAIIDRFGGIRPMATKMNVPVTTVQGWKERGHIPGNRRDDILEAAFLNDIVVTDIIDKNPDFDTLVKTASRKETPVTREKHEHALEAGRITALQDEVAGKVKAAEARAIQKSTIAAILLILTTVFICGFLGWAEIKAVKTQMKQLAAAEDKIKSLEQEISVLREKQTPRDEVLYAQVSELSSRLENIPPPAAAPDIEPLAEKIAKLEEKLESAPAIQSPVQENITDVPPPAAPSPASLLPELRKIRDNLKSQPETADAREKALSVLGDYIQVRKDGQLLTGSPVDAIFEKAEQSAVRGDIDGAVAALETLPPRAREQVRVWIDLARAQMTQSPKPAPALPPAPATEGAH